MAVDAAQEIGQRLDELFGTDNHTLNETGCSSEKIAELVKLIRLHWKSLRSRLLRERIRRHFDVTEHGNSVSVTLK